ncbi:MAG: MFS transporter [bacterium]|nr:MFS transporter [bacterium]
MASNILKNINFSRLLIGQILAHFSDSIIQIALIFWLIENYSNAGKLVVIIFFFFLLPQFIVTPFISNFADKYNRKTILITSNVFRAIIILAVVTFLKFSIFSLEASFSCLIVFAFLLGTGYSFFYSAKIPAITNVVLSNDLKLANSINSGCINFINIFGAAISGLTIQYVGTTKILLLSAIIYLLASGLFALIRLTIPQNFNLAETLFIFETYKSFCYVFRHKVILHFILLSIFISLIASVFINALNILVIDYLNLGISGVTMIRVMHGWGILLGMAFSYSIINKFKLSSFGILAFGLLYLSLAGFYLCNNLLSISLILLPIGIASVMVYIMIDTGLQKTTPDKLRGKVFGIQLALNTLAFLLGMVFILKFVITPMIIIQLTSIITGIIFVALCLLKLNKRRSTNG